MNKKVVKDITTIIDTLSHETGVHTETTTHILSEIITSQSGEETTITTEHITSRELPPISVLQEYSALLKKDAILQSDAITAIDLLYTRNSAAMLWFIESSRTELITAAHQYTTALLAAQTPIRSQIATLTQLYPSLLESADDDDFATLLAKYRAPIPINIYAWIFTELGHKTSYYVIVSASGTDAAIRKAMILCLEKRIPLGRHYDCHAAPHKLCTYEDIITTHNNNEESGYHTCTKNTNIATLLQPYIGNVITLNEQEYIAHFARTMQTGCIIIATDDKYHMA